MVNQYYAEEPSPFRAETLDGNKTPIGKYELWSGRYIIAETFGNPPQGELIELPDATIDLFLPLDRNTRYLNIFQGTSTIPISSINLDESSLVCTPPTVILTYERLRGGHVAPANINFQASVTSNGHRINKVQFYNGATLIGEDFFSPYTFSWSNVAFGTYSVSARVIYDFGNSAQSMPINIVVGSAP